MPKQKSENFENFKLPNRRSRTCSLEAFSNFTLNFETILQEYGKFFIK